MALHSRRREPSPTYPVSPLADRWKQSNEPILSKCPYPAGSGCFHLWLWAAVVEDRFKDPSFKPSQDDWMLFRPSEMAIESLNEYARHSNSHGILGGLIDISLQDVETKFARVLNEAESMLCQAVYLAALQSLCKTVYDAAETIATNVGLKTLVIDPPTVQKKGVAVVDLFWAESSSTEDRDDMPTQSLINDSMSRFQGSRHWRERTFEAIGGSSLPNHPDLYDIDELLGCYASYVKEPRSSANIQRIRRYLSRKQSTPTGPARGKKSTR